MSPLSNDPQEWLVQADYDLDTAEYMRQGGRNSYAVFMCHLAIEKAFKGLYFRILGKTPPKTHNLVYLINQAGIELPGKFMDFIAQLHEAHITTRYPEEILYLQKSYNKDLTSQILANGREVIEWTKQQF